MTTVAILQPTLMPWCGWWEMVDRADIYVAYDTAQFVRKSWHHRQRLKQCGGQPLWLRVPVKHGPQTLRICDVEIDHSQPWAEKQWKGIEQAYRKAPYWDQYGHYIKAIYEGALLYGRLSDFTFTLIMLLRDGLGIRTPVDRASCLRLPASETREQAIVAICEKVGADCIYDAAGAEPLHDWGVVRAAGIDVRFQKYQHPEYSQLHGPSVPFMGALDVLLNCGPEAREIILSGGQP